MPPKTLHHVLHPMALAAMSMLLAGPSMSETWPPSDPNQATAAIEITTAATKGLREARELGDVQKWAGAGGKLEKVERYRGAERAVYSWTGRQGQGSLRLFAYQTGGFAAIIDPADRSGEIVMNSFGAFSCPHCTPPVNACGRRPSWVPHEVHWDTFDCPLTLTGPPPTLGGN